MNLTFMGVAGARFMVAKQLAASGGIYLEEGKTRLALDPGPGAIVQYAKRKVDPEKLSGVLLSHRHLDHCGDVNVLIEAMTGGGFKRRGRLFCPPDCLDEDPVVFQYLRGFPEEIVPLGPESAYRLGELEFTTTRQHVHGGQTFGFVFGERKLGWVTDGSWYEEIAEDHAAEVMLIHVVTLERRDLPHLCLEDAARIIADARPRLAVLTHFGMTMWRARPWELAARLSDQLGVEVKAARDGMRLEL